MLLTQVYVAPDARRGGLGRMLVQGMARDLIERGGIKAVEAFGDTRGDAGWDTTSAPRDHPRGSRCVASVEFLGSVGFKTHRPHARTPRMRMDLRSALTWRDEVEAALEKLIGVVRPAPKPSTERPTRSMRDRPASAGDPSCNRVFVALHERSARSVSRTEHRGYKPDRAQTKGPAERVSGALSG